MPQLSIIIPAFNNSRYLPDCVHSVTRQHYRDIEVIIVDDCSTDDTADVALRLTQEDSRVRMIQHHVNSGTLASRKTGILASHGQFVMLMDQDDELADGSLQSLMHFAHNTEADIYHFGVRVVAENASAEDAATGMSSFLTPISRTLQGEDILRTQFSAVDGFDWHVHHKMYRGNLARTAYEHAADERLVLSDDLYMSFILDSFATTYAGIPNSPWYLYHLGRGDTLGSQLTLNTLDATARRDAHALSMVTDFARSINEQIPRDDWSDRLNDVRDRLIEHTMNEWQDNLPQTAKSDGLQCILSYWSSDAVCGELYRYIRDYAYAYLVSDDKLSDTASANRMHASQYLQETERIEAAHQLPSNTVNQHFLSMRSIARQHLRDSGIIESKGERPLPAKENRLKTMLRTLFASAKR